MTQNEGTLIAAPLNQRDSADSYPTHVANRGQGGHYAVADQTARDAIASDKREWGLRVYMISDATDYVLSDSGDHDLTNNSNWVALPSAADFNSLSGRVEALELLTDSLSGRLDALDLLVDSHSGKILALELLADSLSGRLDALDLLVDSHSGKILALELLTDSLSGRLDALDLLVDSHSGKILALYNMEDIIPIEFCADGATPPDAAEDYENTNAKLRIRKFSGAGNMDVIFQWPVPKYIDTAVKPQFLVEYIISEATPPAEGEIVAFSLAGYSVGNGDNTTAAFGDPITSSFEHSTSGVQHDRYTTAQSGDITVTNLAAGELAFFNLIRLAATTDTYAQKVAVTNVKIFWKRL